MKLYFETTMGVIAFCPGLTVHAKVISVFSIDLELMIASLKFNKQAYCFNKKIRHFLNSFMF